MIKTVLKLETDLYVRVILMVCLLLILPEAGISQTIQTKQRATVGVYYFDGW